MHTRAPLLLLSGMGADARVFAAQQKALPQLRVPAWIPPEKDETLAHYAERFATLINPGEPCFIGGASFGGFVALEMLPHLEARACFLIGSVRSPAEFPGSIQTLRKLSKLAGAIPFELASLMSKLALWSSGPLIGPHGTALLAQLSESDADFLRWACEAVLQWPGTASSPAIPTFQIHGEKDLVLPLSLTRPDVVVPGAGHALSMSHPQAVTDFLEQRINSFGLK